MRLLDDDLGEAVGELYAQKHWTADTERQMTELIGDLRAAYKEKIENAAWMDEATRKEALVKLASFDPRIGHPVKYIDYSNADGVAAPTRSPMRSTADDFGWKLELSRLGKPVDRALWDMNVQEVNAYYNPLMNQVTFPAAILQPPFFDPNADPAVNYGETGATIGHEMGHGFDDEGRQFDATGKLRDWWTKESADRYTAHAQKLVEQFNGYEPIPGVHIKGELTLGENLGDLGGLEAAYAAYRKLRRAARRAGGDRRLHRRPALLHRLCAKLAGQGARGRVARAAALQPAQPGGVSRQRDRAEHGRLVRGVRGEGGGQVVFGPGGPRPRLVTC